jgi:hypothetical protein
VKHIKLESGKKLHIYGQQRGNGRLVARNTEANGGYTGASPSTRTAWSRF